MRMTALLVSLIVLIALVASSTAENLLRNPGFEQVEDGKPVGWRCGGFDWYEEPKGAGVSEVQLDESIVQGAGQRSIKLVADGNRGMVRQTLKYKPEWGRKLQLSGWIKLKNTGSAIAHIGVSFIDDGEWISQTSAHTSWKKSTIDWEYFQKEIEVPENTTHLHFHCRSAKPNDGIMWFDNLALRPLSEQAGKQQQAEADAPEEETVIAADEIEPLVPIDTFETGELEWGGSAWHGAPKAELSIEADGAAVGDRFMRVNVRSANNNWILRHWNYDGPWSGITLSLRAISGSGRLRVYLKSRHPNVVFNVGSIVVEPHEGWKSLSTLKSDITHAWGGKSEKDKEFDPDAIDEICIGYDDAITFPVDEIALDVRDNLAIHTAHADHRANLYAPGERPRVLARILNGYDDQQSAQFEVELTDYNGRTVKTITREITCPGRSYSDERVQLPALDTGYYVATASLLQEGRILTPREVGIGVLPAPSHRGKRFMGASGFGLGGSTADIGYKLGVQSTEIFIDWHRVEPERGEFDFDSLDAELNAFEERDFAVTGMIHLRPKFVPDWATDDAHDFATDPAEFSRFVEAVVDHFEGRIDRWSLCSEVDLAHHGWKNGLDGYVRMVKAGYQRAKRADPDCICGAIGVSGSDCRKTPRFPIARALWPRLADHCDGMFFDLYASPRFFGPGLHVVSPAENDLRKKLQQASEIARKYGSDKLLAIEEKGWAIDPKLDVYNQYSRRMADYLARSYIVARSVDEVDHYMWFQLIVRRLAGGHFSYSLFRFEGDYANPRPAAAAYAFVARFLTGVRQPQPVSLHQDLRAFVFAHDDGSRAALWTPLNETVSLQADLPHTARITDIMGNEIDAESGKQGELLQVSGAPLYVWAEDTPVDELASRLDAASFHLPCAKLAITVPQAGQVRVHVNNQLAEPLAGKLSLQLPHGFKINGAGRQVKMPEGGEKAFVFRLSEWPQPLPKKPGKFLAILRTQEHGVVRRTAEPTFHHIYRLSSAPTIDGDLSEYASIPAIVLDDQKALSPPDAVPNRLWLGSDDLSLNARLAWDAENLYFAAQVHDDAHVQQQTASRIWANDSFQFSLDPRNNAVGKHYAGLTGYDKDDYEFGIALTQKGPQTFRWHGGSSAGAVASGDLAVIRDGDATVYEWALPWAEITESKPVAGRAMGLNFITLDSDKRGERALYWLGLTEGIAGGKNPAAFDTFILSQAAASE